MPVWAGTFAEEVDEDGFWLGVVLRIGKVDPRLLIVQVVVLVCPRFAAPASKWELAANGWHVHRHLEGGQISSEQKCEYKAHKN